MFGIFAPLISFFSSVTQDQKDEVTKIVKRLVKNALVSGDPIGYLIERFRIAAEEDLVLTPVDRKDLPR